MLDRIVNLFGGRGYLLQPDAAEYIMRREEPLAAAEGLAARLAASPSQGARIVTLDLLKRLEVLEAGGLAMDSPEAAVLVAQAVLPYAMGFAAGAMVFVVLEETIPEAERSGNTDLASMAAMVGFVVMMILDVAAG